jgi:hypothetical protein
LEHEGGAGGGPFAEEHLQLGDLRGFFPGVVLLAVNPGVGGDALLLHPADEHGEFHGAIDDIVHAPDLEGSSVSTHGEWRVCSRTTVRIKEIQGSGEDPASLIPRDFLPMTVFSGGGGRKLFPIRVHSAFAVRPRLSSFISSEA